MGWGQALILIDILQDGPRGCPLGCPSIASGRACLRATCQRHRSRLGTQLFFFYNKAWPLARERAMALSHSRTWKACAAWLTACAVSADTAREHHARYTMTVSFAYMQSSSCSSGKRRMTSSTRRTWLAAKGCCRIAHAPALASLPGSDGWRLQLTTTSSARVGIGGGDA